MRRSADAAPANTYERLRPVALELIEVTRGRLGAEATAAAANREIEGKLRDISAHLSELNARIDSLQASRRTTFLASVEDTGTITSRLRAIEGLRSVMKDLQLAMFEIRHGQDKKSLIIARGKANTAVKTALKTAGDLELPRLVGDITSIGGKLEETIKIRTASVVQPSEELTAQYDSVSRDLSEAMSIAVPRHRSGGRAARRRTTSARRRSGSRASRRKDRRCDPRADRHRPGCWPSACRSKGYPTRASPR